MSLIMKATTINSFGLLVNKWKRIRKVRWDRARVTASEMLLIMSSFVLVLFLSIMAFSHLQSLQNLSVLFLFLAYHLPHLCHCFVLPVHTVGCGGGRGRKLHHAVLYPNGWRGVPHPDRDAGYLLPRGPISQRRNHQAPQTSHIRPCHLPCHGVSHQSLLPGRHTGRPQGKYAAGGMCVSLCVCKRLSSRN